MQREPLSPRLPLSPLFSPPAASFQASWASASTQQRSGLTHWPPLPFPHPKPMLLPNLFTFQTTLPIPKSTYTPLPYPRCSALGSSKWPNLPIHSLFIFMPSDVCMIHDFIASKSRIAYCSDAWSPKKSVSTVVNASFITTDEGAPGLHVPSFSFLRLA